MADKLLEGRDWGQRGHTSPQGPTGFAPPWGFPRLSSWVSVKMPLPEGNKSCNRTGHLGEEARARTGTQGVEGPLDQTFGQLCD